MMKAFLFVLMFMFSFSVCNAQNVNITPSSSINDEDTEIVIDAIQMTTNYMKEHFGKSLPFDVQINVGQNSSELPKMFTPADINTNISGRAAMGKINLIIPQNASVSYITFITAHELVHQYQAGVLGGMETLKKNMWFTEGMADIIGCRVANMVDSRMDAAFRKNAKTKADASRLELRKITERKNWQEAFNAKEEPYAVADKALLYLTDNFDDNMMFDYLYELNRYSASEALDRVYGLKVSDLAMIVFSQSYEDNYTQPLTDNVLPSYF